MVLKLHRQFSYAARTENHWSTVMPSASDEKRGLEIAVICLNAHSQLGEGLGQHPNSVLFQALKELSGYWAKFHASVRSTII